MQRSSKCGSGSVICLCICLVIVLFFVLLARYSGERVVNGDKNKTETTEQYEEGERNNNPAAPKSWWMQTNVLSSVTNLWRHKSEYSRLNNVLTDVEKQAV